MSGAGLCVSSKICQAASLQSFSPVNMLDITINKENLVVYLFMFVAESKSVSHVGGNAIFNE